MIFTTANKSVLKTIWIFVLCVVVLFLLCINANAARIKMVDGIMYKINAEGINEGKYTG